MNHPTATVFDRRELDMSDHARLLPLEAGDGNQEVTLCDYPVAYAIQDERFADLEGGRGRLDIEGAYAEFSVDGFNIRAK